MDFVNGLVRYFTVMLDVTMFLQFFFLTAALIILTFPKKINRKVVLFTILKAVIIYAIYVSGESLFFALFNLFGLTVGGILFTASFAVIPIVYIVLFTKDDAIHKIIKIAVVVASTLITAEIGRSLGLIVGEAINPNSQKPLNNHPVVIIVRSVPLFLLPLIANILYKFDITRFKHMPKVHTVLLLTLAAILSASAIWQSTLQLSGTDPDVTEKIKSTHLMVRFLLIFVSSIELFVLVGIYYSIYHLIDYRHRVTELEVQSTVLSLEKESLEIDSKNREELMKIRHDLQNQLSYTKALLNDGKYEEANNYIQSLVNQKEEYLYSFSCSNQMISGIVNLELTKAKIANKKIKFKVVVPPKLPFEDSDLLSLITNIVDNSLENFVPTDDKDVVNVSIVTQQDYLRITSFNSVDQKNIKEKPLLRTTKRDKAHGYGTKIIKNITKKYEGYVTFTFEDGKFVCDCLINMNHKGVNNA